MLHILTYVSILSCLLIIQLTLHWEPFSSIFDICVGMQTWYKFESNILILSALQSRHTFSHLCSKPHKGTSLILFLNEYSVVLHHRWSATFFNWIPFLVPVSEILFTHCCIRTSVTSKCEIVRLWVRQNLGLNPGSAIYWNHEFKSITLTLQTLMPPSVKWEHNTFLSDVKGHKQMMNMCVAHKNAVRRHRLLVPLYKRRWYDPLSWNNFTTDTISSASYSWL